ncbi:hypothetical protein V1477_015916 [Vespula maculifrons]|uniref:Uncharacterized protein n=1 Tax=Vespula maculifrons TaxID=7453 RepID=A0ABD2BBN0_VESMC
MTTKLRNPLRGNCNVEKLLRCYGGEEDEKEEEEEGEEEEEEEEKVGGWLARMTTEGIQLPSDGTLAASFPNTIAFRAPHFFFLPNSLRLKRAPFHSDGTTFSVSIRHSGEIINIDPGESSKMIWDREDALPIGIQPGGPLRTM